MFLVGVVVRRYTYIFPQITYPYSSCICSFLQQPFVHFLKMFFVLVPVLFGNKILCIKILFSRSINTYGQLRGSQGSLHIMFYT